jgi:NADPH-dependent 2,4-dienoyl-CoA reductase/sulfur reductase-like enzyme
MDSFKYVVVGGGMAAGYAAREFVERGVKPGELAILSAESSLPYERPPLSKGFLKGTDSEETVAINAAAFYAEHGIEVRLGTRAEGAELVRRRLLFDGGEWQFDKLLIATGSRARRFEVPGAELEGILYLRSLEDAKRIQSVAAPGRRALVIGGGFIGMEVAASLTARSVEVTLVVAEERVWKALFTPEMSEFFERYYEARGVRLVKNARVARFTGRGRAEALETAAGERLAADFFVAGIGAAPETGLFDNTGVAIQNGILVNEYLESSAPGVYAAGDVANYRDALWGKQRRVEHWDNAVAQGAHAARVMTGTREPFEHVPYFFSDVFDLSYEFWGDAAGADRAVVRGEMASGSFSVWWLREGRLTAAFVMARPEEERELAQEWIRSREPVSAEMLASQPLVRKRAGTS